MFGDERVAPERHVGVETVALDQTLTVYTQTTSCHLCRRRAEWRCVLALPESTDAEPIRWHADLPSTLSSHHQPSITNTGIEQHQSECDSLETGELDPTSAPTDRATTTPHCEPWRRLEKAKIAGSPPPRVRTTAMMCSSASVGRCCSDQVSCCVEMRPLFNELTLKKTLKKKMMLMMIYFYLDSFMLLLYKSTQR
jgi:hypothetical protein